MSIKQLITPKAKDLGDFSVRRVLPAVEQRSVGPWIFFDHMGPADFQPGQGIDVRPHPHINLATVTYLFEGEILHRDSLGNCTPIGAGDVNLMVAGRGITHSEREREAVRNSPHRLHGLQLWHALPEAFEEVEPAFYHYPAQELPAFDHHGVRVRVMMGEAWGVSSPVRTFMPTLYAEASLQAGQTLVLPQAQELAVYVSQGELRIDDQSVPEFSLAVLEPNDPVTIEASKDSRVGIIGGDKLGKRHLVWNFASSRPERIEQAKADWQAGRFPLVPGDEQAFIPLPDHLR